MSGQAFGLIEIVLVFGGVLGFIFWDLRRTNRRIEARRQGRDPDADGK